MCLQLGPVYLITILNIVFLSTISHHKLFFPSDFRAQNMNKISYLSVISFDAFVLDEGLLQPLSVPEPEACGVPANN
jgi:hypothetical protein